MINVVIVDDEPLARERLRDLAAVHPDVAILAESGDGRDAVTTIEQLEPDLIFLDVQMPEFDGFEVLEQLAPRRRPEVVFVTAYDSYAMQAFAVNAVDYLLKPIDPRRFHEAVDRVRRRLAEPGTGTAELSRLLTELRQIRGYPQRIAARRGSAVAMVAVDDIHWIEARGNYARLHVDQESHLVREPLKSLEARLDPARFTRIHRGTIVNLSRIATVEPYFHGEYIVTLKNGTRLTSSRTMSPRFRSLIK